MGMDENKARKKKINDGKGPSFPRLNPEVKGRGAMLVPRPCQSWSDLQVALFNNRADMNGVPALPAPHESQSEHFDEAKCIILKNRENIRLGVRCTPTSSLQFGA